MPIPDGWQGRICSRDVGAIVGAVGQDGIDVTGDAHVAVRCWMCLIAVVACVMLVDRVGVGRGSSSLVARAAPTPRR